MPLVHVSGMRRQEHALSMEQYCLYSLLFRQLTSARGSVQSQAGNQAGTSDEPAVVGGGDTAAPPTVVDPV